MLIILVKLVKMLKISARSVLLVAVVTIFIIVEMEVANAKPAESPLLTCNEHCPDSPFYCLQCCQVHGFRGGRGSCRGSTCYCRI
ncbi:hypothetical protein Ocin01_09515 [Orchesella cincta]|uniref:Uncharacterized protein n=1 Tax=Orchesella cincta TaxID=48709 RepID=A0A1D2MVP8_ORCCI|nr:hypothetical protein Ocin01_09515 [Orchesella cincta]